MGVLGYIVKQAPLEFPPIGEGMEVVPLFFKEGWRRMLQVKDADLIDPLLSKDG